MEEQIIAFRSLGNGHILLTFADGEMRDVDLTPLISKGGIFSRSADDFYLASGVIEDYGYCMEWPGDPVLDMGADTLKDRGRVVQQPAQKIA
jgi:hypothetical protein